MSEQKPAETMTRKTVDEVFGGRRSERRRPLRELLEGFRQPQLQECRDTALQAFKDADGDPDQAIALAEARLRKKAGTPESVITSILVAVAVELIVRMIMHWITEGVSEPAATWQAGEPGADFGDA